MSMDLDNGVMMSSIVEQQRKFHEDHNMQWQHMQQQLRMNGKVAPLNNIANNGRNQLMIDNVANNGRNPLMIEADKANDDEGKEKEIDIAVEGKEAGNGKNSYRPQPAKQIINPKNDIWPRRRKSDLVY